MTSGPIRPNSAAMTGTSSLNCLWIGSQLEWRGREDVLVAIYDPNMTAPAEYDSTAFPPFAVTVDCVVFTEPRGDLHVVLVERGSDPYRGRWAFPGGFVDLDEDLEAAAIRELREETGVECTDLRQLGAYGEPDRDPRMRVVTVVYWADVTDLSEPEGRDDAADARLWPVTEIRANPTMLAFDHMLILEDASAARELHS